MTIPPGTLLLGLALAVIGAVLVAAPLLESKRPVALPMSRREQLELLHKASVSAIRELDFDYRTQKIGEADYKQLREAALRRGADILRELEQSAQPLQGEDADAEIEREVLLRRGKGVAAQTCAKCGASLVAGARFCAQCGTAVGEADPAAAAPAGAPHKGEVRS